MSLLQLLQYWLEAGRCADISGDFSELICLTFEFVPTDFE